MKFYYIKIFILFLSLFSYSNAEIVNVFEFTEEELKNLKVRKIKKETSYTTGNNENGNFLKAVSEGTASGLGKEILINLNKTPFINITWKVEKDLNGIDEKSKKGHDYAARVFVVKRGEQQRYQTGQLTMFFLVTSQSTIVGPVLLQKNL